MSLWVQHGWGKSEKLTDLMELGLLSGVILSPGAENTAALRGTATSISTAEPSILVDPQMYVYSIQDGSARRHGDNGLALDEELRAGMAPSAVESFVRRTVELNHEVGTTHVLAPAPIQERFDDRWFGLSLQLARATLEQETEHPVFASAIIAESAFSETDAAHWWLDEITGIDVSGVYLVAVRDRVNVPYPRAIRPDLLAGQMGLVQGLCSNVDVVVGYADVEGLLMLAAGATAFGSGWSNRLRLFERTSWQSQGGGQPARRRVYCPTLLSPLAVDELRDLPPALRQRLAPALADDIETDSVTMEASHLSFLRGLSGQALVLSGLTSQQQFRTIESWIEEAWVGLDEVAQHLVRGAGQYQNRLRSYRTAINTFRRQ